MITASLVLYNTPQTEVITLLTCVQRSIIDKIYVLDNSPVPVCQFNKLQFTKAEYIPHENTGYGSTHNVALRKAIEEKSEFHLVVNPDIIFTPDVIRKIVFLMQSDTTIGHIMPKILNPAGEVQYLCKLIPTPVDLLFKRFLPGVFCKKISGRFQLKFATYNKIMNVPFLSGCFMFLRINALKNVGLFDERFFMYGEDIDLSRRIHEKYRTVYYPPVSVIHNHAAESYHSKKMLLVHIANLIKYFNKWGWILDKKRSLINKKVLTELGYLK